MFLYPTEANLHSAEGHRRMRRIIAEDPDWSLDIVPSLSNLCLQSIVKNFQGMHLFLSPSFSSVTTLYIELFYKNKTLCKIKPVSEKPIFEQLTPSQRDFVQERLSTSLRLNVTANLVSDGVYWKRCCEQRWDLCDVSNYGNSWKRMFFERHMENIIELFIPDVTDQKTVLAMVPLCKNYVKRLNISQLLPPVKEPKNEEEEEYGSELVNEDEYDRPSIDHFDFNILLNKLTNLEELHLVYRVKQCGMNFEWEMFEMTDRDCESFAKALKSCTTLKVNTDFFSLVYGMLFIIALAVWRCLFVVNSSLLTLFPVIKHHLHTFYSP